VLAAVFVIVSIGLALNTSLGTLSSFGWQAIATICPLGALESLLAAKTIFPRALVVLAVMVLFTIVFGKVFCAWVCPAHPVTRFFDKLLGRLRLKGKKLEDVEASDRKVAVLEGGGQSDGIGASACEDGGSNADADSAGRCSADQACADIRLKIAGSKFDSRHLVLAGSLLSAAVFGFPVFCLICPIGLIFGTIIVVWQFIGFEDFSLSLLIYPAVLIVELLVLRRWCARFCPLGALMSLLSLPNRFLRPQVEAPKCLREKGTDCHVCAEVCPEGIDPHYQEQIHECSKCGLCKDKCPAQAIKIPLKGQVKVKS